MTATKKRVRAEELLIVVVKEIRSLRREIKTQADELRSLTAKTETETICVHRLTQVVQTKLADPSDKLDKRRAAKRMGMGVSTLEKIAAREVFTDYRAGQTRLFATDECDVYSTDGEAGVRRLRLELGRL